MDSAPTLHWTGPGNLTPEIRTLLKKRLDANFSDERRRHGQLTPDYRVEVDVENGAETWEVRLVHEEVPGWPATKPEWAQTQVQSALLNLGIVLPAGQTRTGH